MGFYVDYLLESYGVSTTNKNKNCIEEFNWLSETNQILFENQIQILQEAYYGKSKELLDIEKKIGECREKYKMKQMKFNTSKDRDEIEKMFEDTFGFSHCNFSIISSSLHNACTMPISYEIFNFKDYRKYIVSDGKSIKYNKKARAYTLIQITSGMFFSNIYTDAEILAILLHEVGHNFQTAMSNTCRNLSMVQKIVDIINSPILMAIDISRSPLKNVWYDFCRSARKNFPKLADAYYNFKNVLRIKKGSGANALDFGNMPDYEVYEINNGLNNNIINPFGNYGNLFNSGIIDSVKTIGSNIMTNIFIFVASYIGISFIRATGGTVAESFSDQFTSAHGYGAELSSALRKMRDACGGRTLEQAIRQTPLMRGFIDFASIPERLFIHLIDPHPNTISRIHSQIEYFENEVQNNKNLTPKMKKEIQSQIAATKKEMVVFNDLSDPAYIFTNRIDKLALMAFGGDWRNFLSNGNIESFEQASERAEEQLRQMRGR